MRYYFLEISLGQSTLEGDVLIVTIIYSIEYISSVLKALLIIQTRNYLYIRYIRLPKKFEFHF